MRDLSEQKVSKRLTHPSRFVHQLLTWVKEVIRRAACTKQLLFWCSPEGLNLREKGISQHLQDKVGEKKKRPRRHLIYSCRDLGVLIHFLILLFQLL